MLIFHTVDQLSGYLLHLKHKGQTIGFAPTMGALHRGHLSLLEAAKKHCDKTLSSIFVNPTQFNNPSDFEKYPITIAADIKMLELAGCDILFLPSVAEMYPSGTEQRTDYDLGFLETVLEGSSRPGHFQGVCMVMDRLLSIVLPNHLFMGLKDYQQCMVVKRLLELKGWKQTIQFNACPTLREADGLAMSSRNLRLTEEQRKTAPAIYECLQFIKQNLQPGPLQPIKQQASELLAQKGFKIDYVEIADTSSLELIHTWNGRQSLTALIAAFLGEIRLIDNTILTP
ncbi:pantoate--beta-alanine ligase [Lacibacter sp. MH-610]|uniref:pantoate--beta-alanine ligase n=1 Tax=Lacibacter sp. MH-610 TaxID=3020883 RepID=UPI00389137C5